MALPFTTLRRTRGRHSPTTIWDGGRTADIWIGSSALAANRTFRQQFSMFDVRFRLRSGAEQHTKLIHLHNLFILSPNYRGEICADAYGQGDASKRARPATRASYFFVFYDTLTGAELCLVHVRRQKTNRPTDAEGAGKSMKKFRRDVRRSLLA